MSSAASSSDGERRELKATDGAFNYLIPPGTDISAYRSAIVWCRQFAMLFASAPLETV